MVLSFNQNNPTASKILARFVVIPAVVSGDPVTVSLWIPAYAGMTEDGRVKDFGYRNRSFEALNRTALRGGMGTVTPVRGFLPTLALRIFTCRLPMPARTTFSPDRRASWTARKAASTAELASFRVLSTRPTTRMRLDLFMVELPRRHPAI